ncbi:putative serine/threonine-protein kinase/receptor [Planoprotostelium fungivorum]|uniref:Putative serine/threonine-protein kinase/receptor n=1 Tax=Planoprotostelium fungivorum TaxID=1890364 RepID=A0A2P6NAJ6_9EUKA|nr:putative serine/threonine-protein kinase/receptor [Planoprotostelium fungivorum]
MESHVSRRVKTKPGGGDIHLLWTYSTVNVSVLVQITQPRSDLSHPSISYAYGVVLEELMQSTKREMPTRWKDIVQSCNGEEGEGMTMMTIGRRMKANVVKEEALTVVDAAEDKKRHRVSLKREPPPKCQYAGAVTRSAGNFRSPQDKRDKDSSCMRTSQLYWFLLLVAPSIAVSLFSSGYTSVTNANSEALNTNDRIPLISANGQWKLEFATDRWPQIVHYLTPEVWRWRPLNRSQVIDTNNYFKISVQNDGNVVWYNSSNSPLWSTNHACGASDTPNISRDYAIYLSNTGQLVHNNMTQGPDYNRTLWTGPILTSITIDPNLTTDGGVVYALYNYNQSAIAVQIQYSSSSFVQGQPSVTSTSTSAYADGLQQNSTITIPPGVGTNLTLILTTCNNSFTFPFSYPSPNITFVESNPSFVRVKGRNAGVSSNPSEITLSVVGTGISITSTNVTGGTFSVDLPVPLNVSSGILTVMMTNGQGSLKRNLYYTSPVESVQAIQVNGSQSVSQIFTSIESIAENALKTSDSFEVTNREGVSVYAAVVDQKGNGTVGGLNGTGTYFIIPSTTIRDLLTSGENTTVTVILSHITTLRLNASSEDVTIVGDLIGLSLYLNGSHAIVTNTSERITITLPLPVNVTVADEMRCVYWAEESRGWKRDGCDTERGQSSITCLCSHLTNFTIGVVKLGPEEPPQTGKSGLRLVALIVIVPVVLVIVAIAVIVVKRGRKKDILTEFHLQSSNDIEIEGEVGRGKQSVVYTGKKSGTTAIAIKKVEGRARSESLMREAIGLKELHHPNILMCLGVYREAEMTCLVVDYMDGGTLADVMKRGKLEEEDICEMMTEIAAGLSYLHENGHVHGRICPQKVYVTSSHHVKLSAYGSESLDYIPSYMERYLAPEVKKTGRSTIEGDIFSFGIVFSDIKNERKLKREQPDVWKEVIDSCTSVSAKDRMKMMIVGQKLRPVREHEIYVTQEDEGSYQAYLCFLRRQEEERRTHKGGAAARQLQVAVTKNIDIHLLKTSPEHSRPFPVRYWKIFDSQSHAWTSSVSTVDDEP